MSGGDRQRRHRDRVRLGLYVTGHLALPEHDLISVLVDAGYLTDEDVSDRAKIDAALEAWITEMVTP
jgi:hypothetical protein